MLQMMLETMRQYKAGLLSRSEALEILTDLESAALDVSDCATLQTRSNHYLNLAKDANRAQGELL